VSKWNNKDSNYVYTIMKPRILLITFSLIVLLVACTNEAEPVAQESAEIAPTATRTIVPTEPAPPTPTDVVVATEVVSDSAETTPTDAPAATPLPTDTPIPEPQLEYGITEDGNYYIGFPDAEVVMLDYSDFL
jgi:hypothetical protein